MAETRAQSFDNHGKYRPEYHIVVFFILLANFLWAGYSLFQGLTGGAVVALLMSIALIVMFFSLRVQILTVQWGLAAFYDAGDATDRFSHQHRSVSLLLLFRHGSSAEM